MTIYPLGCLLHLELSQGLFFSCFVFTHNKECGAPKKKWNCNIKLLKNLQLVQRLSSPDRCELCLRVCWWICCCGSCSVLQLCSWSVDWCAFLFFFFCLDVLHAAAPSIPTYRPSSSSLFSCCFHPLQSLNTQRLIYQWPSPRCP